MLMVNGLRQGHRIDEHESFADFHYCDSENCIYSHSHYNFLVIFHFERFFKNLKNGSIHFCETFTGILDIADILNTKFS